MVRAQFDAVNRGDFPAATDTLADDVVLTLSGDGPNAGTYEGKAAVVGFFTDWFRVFPAPLFELGEIVAQADRVALSAHHVARGRESGVAVAQDFFYAYRVLDERIVRIEILDSFVGALAAAGIQDREDANG